MQPRYAQESHTHSGLVGGAGEGWSGIVCSAHANAGGSLVANGFTITTTGTTTSVTETLSLSGSTIEKYPRAAVRNAGNFAGHYCSVGTKYLNTLRGFHLRILFGTMAYSSANTLFGGMFAATPAAALTSFSGWASTYAMGVWKDSSTGALDWVWRTDSSTTGSASSGMTWANGEMYMLELDCEPAAAGGVVATLTCTDTTSATYTFSTFPDANTDPAAVMAPGVLMGATGSTTQLQLHSMDTVEPW